MKKFQRCPVGAANRQAGFSMTPSSDKNSVTTSFLIIGYPFTVLLHDVSEKNYGGKVDWVMKIE